MTEQTTDQKAALAAANMGALRKMQNASSWSDHMEELMMGREDRKPADALSEWALTEYERLQQEAPNVSGATVKAFHAKFGHAENIPDCAEDEFIIKIQGREDNVISVKEE